MMTSTSALAKNTRKIQFSSQPVSKYVSEQETRWVKWGISHNLDHVHVHVYMYDKEKVSLNAS